ncbi:hypothetical protein A2619_05790 [candidate division WWE3 bacterium RIFOXYD1_FULL_39_9]|uniref:Prophage tail endopeptidase domain-containing protein n=1 Tax=candidate division WWE3 bacterium RIFOXYD1_FULL_39_9 TaxID=1802649 RepID=A0A1F4X3Z5_UNCKA|nr:MAG: hypothetical protein A2619_05790 [candidate division WWE3 bacterium RIFOXYD1_FULL_39_9]
MSEIILKVNGKEFSGWKELEINQSLDQLASSFAFSYTEKYPNQFDSFDFTMGEEAVVEINGTRLITGYVEEIDKNYDSSNHVLQIRGRDKLGDLVDCSYYQEGKSGEWLNQTVETLVKNLVAPFGISVVVDETVRSTANERHSFKIKEGDTVADSLSRLMRLYAFLPVSYGDGKLTMTRAASNRKAVNAIESGKNVLAGNSYQSNTERFSKYIVKGSNTGDPFHELETYIGPSRYAVDPIISRSRPIVIIHEDKSDKANCQNRADWESMVRAGKSRSYKYVINDWLQKDGTPWPLNATYSVVDSINKVNGSFLSSSIIFRLGGWGKITEITLVDEKTYKLIRMPEKITGSNDDVDILGMIGA